MTSEKWRMAWDLYSSARELQPPQRATLLSSITTDPEVLEEVSLLLDEPDEQAPEAEQNHTVRLASFGMGRYAVIDYLGKGGMSEVYSAQDLQLGRTVALKFLLPGTIGGRSAERVMQEAKTLSGLNHPNIVTVYEVIQSPSGLAIVMELVEGAALRSLCGISQHDGLAASAQIHRSPTFASWRGVAACAGSGGGALPEDQVVRLGLQIAQALAAAHAHGIAHRDIKPENILVRPDGYVKVVDFGLARQFLPDDATSECGLTMGTLRYMSPEQVRGSPVSPASDIFSLGLVLYELLAGEHPFAGDTSLQTAYCIATKPLALLSDKLTAQPATARLEKLIAAMLAKDPAERPLAVRVARELDGILLSSGNVAPRRIARGKLRFWLAGVAACLLGIAAAGWFAYTKRDAAAFADLNIRPLTSQAGWENAPALSPDGRSSLYVGGQAGRCPK